MGQAGVADVTLVADSPHPLWLCPSPQNSPLCCWAHGFWGHEFGRGSGGTSCLCSMTPRAPAVTEPIQQLEAAATCRLLHSHARVTGLSWVRLREPAVQASPWSLASSPHGGRV